MFHRTTIRPKPSTGHGDIGGYAVLCSCGDYATWSLLSMADHYAQAHPAYMERMGR